MHSIHRIFFLVVFLAGSLFAVEDEDVKTPDPASLAPDWWNYFDVPKENLSQRVEVFLTAVNQIPSELSSENKEIASSILGTIQINLAALEKQTSEPIPDLTPASPISDSYSIKNLIDLNHNLRKADIDLASQQQEAKDLVVLLKTQQSQLDRETLEYQDADERSEAREIIGLRMISARIKTEVTRREIERNSALIEHQKIKISHLNDELAKAPGRVQTDRDELLHLARLLSPAEDQWKESQEQLEIIEKRRLELPEGEDSAVTTARGDSHEQELLQAQVKNIQAHNGYISAQINYVLSKLLLEPESVNHLELDQSITKWEVILSEFEKKISIWINKAQNLTQKTGQLLSIQEFQDLENPQQYKNLLQKQLNLAQSNLVSLQKLKNEVQDTAFILKLLDYQNSVHLGKGAFWKREISNYFYRFFSKFRERITNTLFYVGNRPITLWGILRFFLIILIAFWLSRSVLHRLTDIIQKRRGINKAMIYRINRLIQYLILIVGLLIALTALGFDFSNLILLTGALGVGLGFGLQSIFNNFISGIIILFQSHLKVGDYVELESGIRGEIREINVRSTTIRTNNGLEALIPNSEMISRRLINWTLEEPYRRVQVPFSVAYGTDKELVKKVVLEVANQVPLTLHTPGIPEPKVYLSKFGDNALEFELVVWVDKKATRRSRLTLSAYLWEIETAFRENSIQIPFPQRDLHIKDACPLNIENQDIPHNRQ